MVQKEKLLKSYETHKKSIDLWFKNFCLEPTPYGKIQYACECISVIGESTMISLILEKDYGINLEQERKYMLEVRLFMEKYFKQIGGC